MNPVIPSRESTPACKPLLLSDPKKTIAGTNRIDPRKLPWAGPSNPVVLPSQVTDTLICWRTFSLYTIEHLPLLLNAVGDALRPGGTLWVVEADLSVLANRYKGLHTQVGDLNDILFDGEARKSIWEPALIISALEAIGFQDPVQVPVTEFPYCDVWDDWLCVVRTTRP